MNEIEPFLNNIMEWALASWDGHWLRWIATMEDCGISERLLKTRLASDAAICPIWNEEDQTRSQRSRCFDRVYFDLSCSHIKTSDKPSNQLVSLPTGLEGLRPGNMRVNRHEMVAKILCDLIKLEWGAKFQCYNHCLWCWAGMISHTYCFYRQHRRKMRQVSYMGSNIILNVIIDIKTSQLKWSPLYLRSSKVVCEYSDIMIESKGRQKIKFWWH